jgi:hypothetical protein
MRLVLCALVLLAACHDHDHDEGDYATFQTCYDDHVGDEGLPHPNAIVICCLEHTFNGAANVCGADANSCKAYLATNLSSTTASQTDIDAGCADYVTQKGM